MPEAAPDVAGPDVVAATSRQLASLRERPVAEHVQAYGEVHRLLQDALGRLDEG